MRRREPRFGLGVRVQLRFTGHELETLTRDVSEHGMFVYAEHGPPRGAELVVAIGDAIELGCVVRHVVAGVGVGIELTTREGADVAAYRELVARQRALASSWQVAAVQELEDPLGSEYPLLVWAAYDEALAAKLAVLFASGERSIRSLETDGARKTIEVLDSVDVLFQSAGQPATSATLFREDGDFFVVFDAEAARVRRLSPGDELMIIDFG